MSSSLVWRPICESKTLPDTLKFVLRKRGLPRTFSAGDYDYVHALMDAGVDGAEELMELINTHHEVELLEES